ncbi:MAG TPA: hypothetical protein VNE41_04890 [Chitinophagaceae bacterium]|nr:hypothetical protein [Chitinophagaceae bacterium]
MNRLSLLSQMQLFQLPFYKKKTSAAAARWRSKVYYPDSPGLIIRDRVNSNKCFGFRCGFLQKFHIFRAEYKLVMVYEFPESGMFISVQAQARRLPG